MNEPMIAEMFELKEIVGKNTADIETLKKQGAHIEKIADGVQKLATNMASVVTNVENIEKKVDDIKDEVGGVCDSVKAVNTRVDNIVDGKSKFKKEAILAICTAVVGLVVGYFLK